VSEGETPCRGAHARVVHLDFGQRCVGSVHSGDAIDAPAGQSN
jgi:hypothetical protein